MLQLLEGELQCSPYGALEPLVHTKHWYMPQSSVSRHDGVATSGFVNLSWSHQDSIRMKQYSVVH